MCHITHRLTRPVPRLAAVSFQFWHLTSKLPPLPLPRFISSIQKWCPSRAALPHNSTPSPSSTLTTAPTSSWRSIATWWWEPVDATRLSPNSSEIRHTHTHTHTHTPQHRHTHTHTHTFVFIAVSVLWWLGLLGLSESRWYCWKWFGEQCRLGRHYRSSRLSVAVLTTQAHTQTRGRGFSGAKHFAKKMDPSHRHTHTDTIIILDKPSLSHTHTHTNGCTRATTCTHTLVQSLCFLLCIMTRHFKKWLYWNTQQTVFLWVFYVKMFPFPKNYFACLDE